MANALVSYLLHWWLIYNLVVSTFQSILYAMNPKYYTSEYLDGITLNSCISIQELIIFPILSFFYNKYR